jgi:predicted site-specific integrase-resolvase
VSQVNIRRTLNLIRENEVCSSNNVNFHLMRVWLEVGNGYIKVLCRKGEQEKLVSDWVKMLKERGANIISRSEDVNRVTLVVKLPD